MIATRADSTDAIMRSDQASRTTSPLRHALHRATDHGADATLMPDSAFATVLALLALAYT
jgi:hypothetical protein